METRRGWISSILIATGGWGAGLGRGLPSEELAAIESESGGRLGVAMIDGRTGKKRGWRANERFPMCSTFKALAAAAILKRVDEGKERLERRIPIHKSDLLEYAPATRAHVGSTGMTVEELCAAAITLSDNTAANLLLAALGGPSGVTDFARTIGDGVTRLDRTEPTLNEATPGDPRDTTTPLAMALDLQRLVLGGALSGPSRALLKSWLLGCKTGDKKIRAGLPAECRVGDKTGSGERNTSNDAAVVWPPNGMPFVLTVYLTGSGLDVDGQSGIIAKAARACWLGSLGKTS